MRIANDTPYGLSAYLYTRDVGRIWRVSDALDYGIVGINTGFVSTEVAPFGGMKESGIGREGSRYGIDEWLEMKYLAWEGSTDDRRGADVPAPHRQAAGVPAAVRRGGSAIQERSWATWSGGSPNDIGDVNTIVHLWGYEDLADGSAGARRWRPNALAGVREEAAAADRLAAQPHPDAGAVVADRGERARRQGRDRHRRRAGHRPGDRRRARGRGREGRDRRPGRRRGGGGRLPRTASAYASTSPPRPTARMAARPCRPLRPHRRARQQRRHLLVAGAQPLEEIAVDEWRKVFDVNVLGMFLATRAVLPQMRAQGGGRIVNISSGTPFKGVPFLLHYVDEQGRRRGDDEGDREGGRRHRHPRQHRRAGLHDVRRRAREPRGQRAAGDLGEARDIQRDQFPSDVVGAIVFFCCADSSFITGQTLVVDGGQYFN